LVPISVASTLSSLSDRFSSSRALQRLKFLSTHPIPLHFLGTGTLVSGYHTALDGQRGVQRHNGN